LQTTPRPGRRIGSLTFIRRVAAARTFLFVILLPFAARPQAFYPLKDVRPGLHGIGRTVFNGSRIEEFQVEILGTLENLNPKQAIILAKLSGGPLLETGVLQGMSGSPVYIDNKLLGAVALGFPFSKEPIAGIQPIEPMIADSRPPSLGPPLRSASPSLSAAGSFSSSFGSLSEILSPVALSGFTPATLQTFAASFRRLGFDPQQGVSSGSPTSQRYSGTVVPGSMISVQLLSGDMSISADGTVTYVDGNRVYAFGHRFLDSGATDLPFARADVIALLPALNTSFKLSAPREWVGSMTSDRSTAVAGEIGRRAHTIPLTISVRSAATGAHDYHMQVVSDRLLTPFVTQTALFSVMDATERAVGAATLRLQGRIEFEGDLPALVIRDTFVSDSAVPQQAAADAVVPLGFVLGGGFANLRMKNISFDLEPLDSKRQLRIAQSWTSKHEVRPGDSIQITTVLQGENGIEFTPTITYQVPVGAPLGPLNFTISDANTLNFPEFAGLSQSSLRTPAELVRAINAFRPSDAIYVRVWRQEPAFTISGPMPGGELTDPPPSVMLILADPSSSATTNPAVTLTRGSGIAELSVPVSGYVVTGAKTIQVDVKE
jgi:SpoIVB peptidase S55